MVHITRARSAMTLRRLKIDHDLLTDHDPLTAEPYHFAVIDIGSNSVRLVVYDDLSRAPFPRFNEKSLCGLGAGLDAHDVLSAESIERTVRAVSRFCAIARAMHVDRIDAFATEATRRAANGKDLVDAIHRRSGLHVRILSGAEEATYSALGVISGFYRPQGVASDMGGGSLEIAEIRNGGVGKRTVSLPLGTLPVTAMMAHGQAGARRRIDTILRQRLPTFPAEPVFYAIGGGWRALARVHIAAKAPPISVAHGHAIDAKEARAFAKKILQMGPNELANLAGVPSRRAATLPAAVLVLDRVLKMLKADRVVFSALGLREGWLYAQLAPEDRRQDPLIEGARSLALATARVPAFGASLVDWTKGLFPRESTEDRRLRIAACLLSDLSWRDHPDARATESFRRLLTFPFTGIDHAERAFIGAAVHARYLGKPDDPALEPAKVLLTESLLRKAVILGRALSLGYRLSGSVPGILAGSRLLVRPGAVSLEVTDSDSVPDSDAVRTRLRQFARAAGLNRAEIRVGIPPVIDIVNV